MSARPTSQPKILFVTPVSPFSAASGSEQRSALMLTALASVGEVDVLQLKQGQAEHIAPLPGFAHNAVLAETAGGGGPLARYRPKALLTQRLEQALGYRLADYQLIVGRYVWPVCQLLVPATVPVVADLDDYRYRYAPHTPWTGAVGKERLLKAVAHQLVRRQLKRFAGAYVVSAQDQREVAQASKLPTAFLPNVPYSSAAVCTPVPQDGGVLFVGSLWYRPNADGVNWFLTNVWPTVRSTMPNATLTLVGAAPATVRAAWAAHPGVTSPGFVDDLAAAYQQASLVVVPLHSGGGTNIKVLEALAYGRPCLMTDFVAKAFDGYLAPQSDILVANSAEDYASQTVAALRNPARLQGVAAAGHSAVQRFFTVELFKLRVADMARQRLIPKA